MREFICEVLREAVKLFFSLPLKLFLKEHNLCLIKAENVVC